MAEVSIQAFLPWDLRRVWETVTAVEHYGWRSDLSRTEVLGGGRFVEYTREGYPTAFTTTAWEPCRRWEFDLENKNLRGHWTGLFRPLDGGTEVELTESVTPKNPLLRLIVPVYLRRQQARFLDDLKRELERGWDKERSSPIRSILVQSYIELFGKEPIVNVSHGANDCVVLKHKIPEMDVVTTAATYDNCHTPRECLNMDSFEKVFYLLQRALLNMTKIC